jgi:hypothetical protein
VSPGTTAERSRSPFAARTEPFHIQSEPQPSSNGAVGFCEENFARRIRHLFAQSEDEEIRIQGYRFMMNRVYRQSAPAPRVILAAPRRLTGRVSLLGRDGRGTVRRCAPTALARSHEHPSLQRRGY